MLGREALAFLSVLMGLLDPVLPLQWLPLPLNSKAGVLHRLEWHKVRGWVRCRHSSSLWAAVCRVLGFHSRVLVSVYRCLSNSRRLSSSSSKLDGRGGWYTFLTLGFSCLFMFSFQGSSLLGSVYFFPFLFHNSFSLGVRSQAFFLRTS